MTTPQNPTANDRIGAFGENQNLSSDEQQAILAAIPFDQLLSDREEMVDDIGWCTMALEVGVLRYGGPDHNKYSVQNRLDLNRKMLITLDEELGRRNCVVLTLQGDVKGSEFFHHEAAPMIRKDQVPHD